MNELQSIFITGIIFWTIYKVFETALHRKERLQMIEKCSEISGVDLSDVFGDKKADGKQSFIGLRFGLLFVGIGLGLLVGILIASQTNCIDKLSTLINWGTCGFFDTIIGASVLVFGGLGLLASYLIEAKRLEK